MSSMVGRCLIWSAMKAAYRVTGSAFAAAISNDRSRPATATNRAKNAPADCAARSHPCEWPPRRSKRCRRHERDHGRAFLTGGGDGAPERQVLVGDMQSVRDPDGSPRELRLEWHRALMVEADLLSRAILGDPEADGLWVEMGQRGLLTDGDEQVARPGVAGLTWLRQEAPVGKGIGRVVERQVPRRSARDRAVVGVHCHVHDDGASPVFAGGPSVPLQGAGRQFRGVCCAPAKGRRRAGDEARRRRAVGPGTSRPTRSIDRGRAGGRVAGRSGTSR